MAEKITEEMGVHKAWYEEADKQTVDTIGPFIQRLCAEYDHDYGTICHAIAAAALAAAKSVNKSPQGGITGFQAGAIMWEFVQRWMHLEEKPLALLQYENLIYPQYASKFTTISAETLDWVRKEAAKRLKEPDNASESVRKHWEAIAGGAIPFGLGVRQ